MSEGRKSYQNEEKPVRRKKNLSEGRKPCQKGGKTCQKEENTIRMKKNLSEGRKPCQKEEKPVRRKCYTEFAQVNHNTFVRLSRNTNKMQLVTEFIIP